MFTLYHADFIGNPGNCSYPHKIEVTDASSLIAAVSHDYVCAEYRNSYRNGENYIGSNCLPVDCDNDHSEQLEDWVLPADVMEAFPGVTFAVHYSRYNMREKNGKPARPKFHVLFPIDHVTNATRYSDMKKLVNAIFPYFDTKALDAARFFFGTTSPEVEIYTGSMNLSEFLEGEEFDADMAGGHRSTQVIPEGSRNATMSRFAGRVIKKYGDSEAAFQCFLEEAAKCSPPLEETELMTIWHSAQRFFSKVQQQDGYVSPEVYNDPTSYMPGDFSDVGQAEVLAKYFSGELRYSPATHFIRYTSHYWQESEPGAQAVAHELTRRQLEEATKDLQSAMRLLTENGTQEILENASKAKAESLMNDTQLEAYRAFLSAKAYQSFAIRRRDSKNISATLKESRPMESKGGRASTEYQKAFWNAMRTRSGEGLDPVIRNALQIGTDTEGGYLVPDEFERTLIEALNEENIFRKLASVITTSSGDRKIPVVASKGTASWIDEEGAIPESDDSFGQAIMV